MLRIPDKSERVVTPGAPLLVVGDPSQLEVVIDLLSTEAVKVKPGMPVLLEGWGGDRPLQARVRVVEPLAFTKVSALGVEEQRVNVIADFVDPPGRWAMPIAWRRAWCCGAATTCSRCRSARCSGAARTGTSS